MRSPFSTFNHVNFFLGTKSLEKAQREYDSLKRLISGLDRVLPFIESVQGRVKENVLKDTVLALLDLMEDVSNFVINYLSHANAGAYPFSRIFVQCSHLL